MKNTPNTHRLNKSFDFCYGHRVYSQDVVEKYSGSPECPCHRIHGHQGNVTIHMQTESLDSRGFVIDFKELNFVKKFIDTYVDHRFVISTLDPNFATIVGEELQQLQLENVYMLDDIIVGQRVVNPNSHTESFLIVDFNPTSEELAKWIYDNVTKVIEQSPFECSVEKVVWSETPKTSATYG